MGISNGCVVGGAIKVCEELNANQNLFKVKLQKMHQILLCLQSEYV